MAEREATGRETTTERGRKLRVLHVIHDFLPRHRAGSEIYAYELCRALRARGHEVHVLSAEYDPAARHGSLRWRSHGGIPVTELVNNWEFSSFEESYCSPRIIRQLRHVLRAVQPDLLHLHNLLNLSLDLPAIAAGAGIPTLATLHDFTLVCPSGGQRVHVAEQHVCTTIDPARCARCFPQSPLYLQMVLGRLNAGGSRPTWAARLAGRIRRRFPLIAAALGRAAITHLPRPALTPQEIEQRLSRAREVFDAVELFVAPSRALGEEYLRLGIPAHKLMISDYGFAPLARCGQGHSSLELRIGFVGTLVWHKGPHLLLEAARQLPEGRFRLLFFGSVETFPDYTKRLRELAGGLAVELRGGFEPDQVGEIYREMDVLVVPSLWPENSPLVIHEAFMAGVPVVGARIGGVPELVSDGDSGLLYDPSSPTELAAALRSLIENPGLLERFRQALPAVKTIDEDARAWEERYLEVLWKHADSRAWQA